MATTAFYTAIPVMPAPRRPCGSSSWCRAPLADVTASPLYRSLDEKDLTEFSAGLRQSRQWRLRLLRRRRVTPGTPRRSLEIHAGSLRPQKRLGSERLRPRWTTKGNCLAEIQYKSYPDALAGFPAAYRFRAAQRALKLPVFQNCATVSITADRLASASGRGQSAGWCSPLRAAAGPAPGLRSARSDFQFHHQQRAMFDKWQGKSLERRFLPEVPTLKRFQAEPQQILEGRLPAVADVCAASPSLERNIVVLLPDLRHLLVLQHAQRPGDAPAGGMRADDVVDIAARRPRRKGLRKRSSYSLVRAAMLAASSASLRKMISTAPLAPITAICAVGQA